MVIQRGEIWWAVLCDPKGSEPGFRRPVLVLSADAFNRSRIRTCTVAAITSNLKLARAPGNVRLSKRISGLSKESVVNVSQMLTVDKSLLAEKVKMLKSEYMAQVDNGVLLALGLRTT